MAIRAPAPPARPRRSSWRLSSSALGRVTGEPSPGDEIGLFRLEEVLGRGSTATVYRAKHQLFGTDVALKVLLPQLRDQMRVLHRFIREANTITQARHPNIVTISDLVTDAVHPPFIVMEYLPGRDLLDYLESKGPLPPRRAVGICLQLCDALQVVHALDIVHRDLKPENILVVDEKQDPPLIKLLDFGLAKHLEAEWQDGLSTQTGRVMGTPEFLAPELIRGKGLHPSADIYAAGLILYELLTGRPAFVAIDVESLLMKHLNELPPPASSVVADPHAIPPELDDLIFRCLAKRPDARFASASELGEALQALPELTNAPPVHPAVRDGVVDHPPSPSRDRSTWWMSVAVVVLILAGGGLALYAAPSSDAGLREVIAPVVRSAAPPTHDFRPVLTARRVRLFSTPSRANLVDARTGKRWGITPAVIELRPGERLTLRVTRPGYRPAKVTIRSDSLTSISVVLSRRAERIRELLPDRRLFR